MHRAAAACTLAKGDAPISLPLLLSLHRSDANHWKMHPADVRPAWLSPGSSKFQAEGDAKVVVQSTLFVAMPSSSWSSKLFPAKQKRQIYLKAVEGFCAQYSAL